MYKPKSPIIKGKGFCPNPIAIYGIPKYADSRLNKNVIGTPDWEKFWDEQLHYIVHGYQTGGIHVPGRYYYFANYKIFDTVKGPINAAICDVHMDIAYFIDYCKANGKNGIFAKKRRGGISEAFITMGADYGYRFFPGYKVGVAGGLKTFVDGFMEKWHVHNNIIVPEFKVKHKGTEDIVACYDIIDDGGKREDGTFNTIYPRSMFQNANLFKGLYLNDVYAEEGVEFKKLKQFFNASKACFMDGSIQIGNFFTWGTGGNRSSNGDDFEEMWNKPESFNMERLFIKGTKFYFPFYGGAVDDFGDDCSKVPNLRKDYKDYQIIGVEDEIAAEEDIKFKRQVYLDAGDIEGYIEFCQDNPLLIEEVFKKVSSNKFDIESLNRVGFHISSNPKEYIKYKLEWVKNKDGERVTPLKVEAVPAKDTDKDEDCILISLDGHPVEGVPNLYSSGLDSYDIDEAKTSKSLGAMLVLIRDHTFSQYPKMKPVCVLRKRPRRKEEFYEDCLKIAVYYNLTNNVLVDVAKRLVIEYFQTNGGTRFLARRPQKIESVNSEQTHEYGLAITKQSRPLMVSLMQSFIFDHADNIVFPDLVNELRGYDEYTTDSDNDLADALGIALVQHLSNSIAPRDNSLKDKNKKFLLNDDLDFNPPKLKSLEQDHDGFGLR